MNTAKLSSRLGWRVLSGLLIYLGISSQSVLAIEEVAVIGTRTATPLSQLPGNIFVLGEEALQTLSPVHIQQALSQVPGVNYQRGNGQESLPGIRSAVLTGAGACGNVLVLEEAIAVRGAGFCNVNELFDTHFEQASSIEVVRGANTAFYGSNALLGSINVSLPLTGPNRLSLELGANDFRRAKAAVSYRSGESSQGRLFLTVAEDGGFRDDSGYQQQKLSWRHATSLEQWDVSLGASITHLDQETAGFVVGPDSYKDPVLRRQNLDPQAFRKSESLRAWASFSKTLEPHQSIKITPYLRFTEMDFLQHFLPGNPLEQNQQQGFGWQSSLTVQASPQLQWSMGFDAELSRGELLQTQAQPTPGSAFLQATIPTGRQYDYLVDARQFGLFGHAAWQLAERWQMIAGLRLEHMQYQYDNLALDGRSREDGTECGFGGCRYSRPADRKDDFTHLSPKLELQYQANLAWRWHVAVADAFRAPQATELYRLQRAQTVADLDTVRAMHLEAGVQWRHQQTRVDVTLYRIEQSNVIIRDSDFFNIDGQRIDSVGLELSFQHAFNKSWSTRLAAAYAGHEYASDQAGESQSVRGNKVDTAPELVGSATLTWQPNSRLSTELELQHVSAYFLDAENAYEYPGHTLLNWRGKYRIDDRWTASLRLLNLSNKYYAERADFTTFTNERYFPGEPRSLFGEIQWEF